MVVLIISNDIVNDLLTPENLKATLAFLIGFIGGVAGAFIRSTIRYNSDTLPFFRRGDLPQFLTWPVFGALLAATLNSHPFFSLMFGVFAPLLYALLEKRMPQFLLNLLPTVTKGNKKDQP